jgi:hypothetical protein
MSYLQAELQRLHTERAKALAASPAVKREIENTGSEGPIARERVAHLDERIAIIERRLREAQ